MSTLEDVDLKQEFQNNSPGWLGATVITGRNQDPRAIPVAPGDRIFLSREEQLLTSRAHQRDEDSPFKNGLDAVSRPGRVSPDRLVPYDEAVEPEPEPAPEPVAAATPDPAPVPEPVVAATPEPAPEEITGVKPQPAGDAGVGVQAKTEIAGTPEAQKKPKPEPAVPLSPTKSTP